MKEKRNRILVVDDAKSIRDILKLALSAMGFSVVAASDGDEGYALFCEHPCDLVLTDLRMPRMDGLHLARLIKHRSPGTRVVLITGEEKKTVIEGLSQRNVDTVLFKPFGLEEVESVVASLWRSLEKTGDEDDLHEPRVPFGIQGLCARP